MGDPGNREMAQRTEGKCVPFFIHRWGTLRTERDVKLIRIKVLWERHLAEGRTWESGILLQAHRTNSRLHHLAQGVGKGGRHHYQEAAWGWERPWP